MVALSVPVLLGDPATGRFPWFAAAPDGNGLGSLMTEIRRVTGEGSMTIGWGGNASAGAPVVFPGFDLSAGILARRALAFLPPLALLSAAFALLSFLLVDVATREERTGLSRVVAATPGAGGRLAAVKLASAGATALLVLGPLAAKASAAHALAIPAAVAGALFTAALAVALGLASGSPKPFVGFLLALWYVATNDKGRTAALDLAGFSGAATPGSIAGWLAAAALLAAVALLLERLRLARA